VLLTQVEALCANNEDYALQIRAHLKRGRLPMYEPEQGQYLDIAEFWKQRSMAVEARYAELESHAIKIERTVRNSLGI
jgi:hypothetical protein